MHSHSLKISGKVELGQALELDKNYSIAVMGSLVNISTSPNHDGTLSYTYSLKPVNVLVHDDLGNTIKAKDPRSHSTKFRSFCKYQWDSGLAGTKYKEFDDFYDAVYKGIYENYDFIVSKL